MAKSTRALRSKLALDSNPITLTDDPALLAVASDAVVNVDNSLATALAAAAPDSDGDGVPDNVDNALIVANPDQRDTDSDGYGNIVDPDFNQDGVVTAADYVILRGKLNKIDPLVDLNGDGRVTAADYVILRGFLNKPPGPNFNSPHVIWQNGTAGVTVGTAAAPTTFSVGTNAAAPAGDLWTGAIPSGSDNWSILDNWADTSVPTATDRAIFNATDSGGLSRVDPAFEGTIGGYADTGQGIHTIQLDRALQVNGPVSIHTANAYNLGLLNVFNTQLTLHLTDLNVGRNAAASGTATGWLTIDAGTVVDATDVDRVNIGYSSGGSATGTLNLASGAALTLGSGALSVGTASGGGAKGALNVASGAALTLGAGSLALGSSAAGDSEGTLKLGSNSTLNVGSPAAPADLNLGWHYGGGGQSSGVLDALDPAADVNLDLNALYLGRSNGVGIDTGTLRWNQSEVIHANVIYVGLGGGATGVLDVPAGGTLLLGTAADPIGILDIAQNNTGGANKNSNKLDFSLTNPTFTGYIGNELRIGASGSGDAEGTLKLASNSTLNVGSTAAPADLNLGWHYGGGGQATGVFDALDPAADVNLHLNALYLGRSNGVGIDTGTFLMGAGVSGDANLVGIGVGTGASGLLDVLGGTLKATTLTLASGALDFHERTLTVGTTGTLAANTLNLSGGLLTGDTLAVAGGTLNFTGGALSVDTVNGLLDQNGGTLAPGSSPGETVVNGNYDLSSPGALKIEVFGNTFTPAVKEYDRLTVNGTVKLNGDGNPAGGGTLDIDLGYSPSVGTSFIVLDNDGTDAIGSRFKGMLEGSSFDVSYGTQTVTFQITYFAGTGNDIAVTVTNKVGAAPAGLTVTGTSASELLSGSINNDTIEGLAGNDILTGGPGNDVLVFNPGFGCDRITDFSPGSDHIQLAKTLGLADFAALDTSGNGVLDAQDAHVLIAGSDTIIQIGAQQIDVVGQAALHSSDFAFV